MAVASGIEYKMYAGSEVMKTHILSYLDGIKKVVNYNEVNDKDDLFKVAEEKVSYGNEDE